MRVRMELSEMPPVFTVEEVNGMANITFYTDIQPVERGKETAYSAIAWNMACPWTSSLQKRIESNMEAWLSKAKELCTAEAAAEVRAKRNELLASTDAQLALDRLGLEVPDGNTFTVWLSFLSNLGKALVGSWAVYRQRLRDLPQQPGFPFDIEWPERPVG